MARGKHGARAANRRATEAGDRISELEAMLAEERRAHKLEVVALEAEIQNLRGTQVRKIKEASTAAIQEARDAATAQVAEVRDRADARIREAFKFLFAHAEVRWDFGGAGKGGAGDVSRMADLAGIPYGEFLELHPDVTLNHAGRRATSRTANLNADIRRSSEPIIL